MKYKQMGCARLRRQEGEGKIHFDGFSQRKAEMCNEYNISWSSKQLHKALWVE